MNSILAALVPDAISYALGLGTGIYYSGILIQGNLRIKSAIPGMKGS